MTHPQWSALEISSITLRSRSSRPQEYYLIFEALLLLALYHSEIVWSAAGISRLQFNLQSRLLISLPKTQMHRWEQAYPGDIFMTTPSNASRTGRLVSKFCGIERLKEASHWYQFDSWEGNFFTSEQTTLYRPIRVMRPKNLGQAAPLPKLISLSWESRSRDSGTCQLRLILDIILPLRGDRMAVQNPCHRRFSIQSGRYIGCLWYW